MPQLPQRDPGRTIDWLAGMRAMQTSKKLPQIAPNTAANAVANGDDSKAAISSMRTRAYRTRIASSVARLCRAELSSSAVKRDPLRVPLVDAKVTAGLEANLGSWSDSRRCRRGRRGRVQAQPGPGGGAGPEGGRAGGRAEAGCVRGGAEAHRRRALPRHRAVRGRAVGRHPERGHDDDRRVGGPHGQLPIRRDRTIATAAARWCSTGASSPLRYAMGR